MKTDPLLTSVVFLISQTALSAQIVPNCPKSLSEWNQWREDLVRNAFSPYEITANYRQTTAQCVDGAPANSISRDPQLAACLAPLRQISDADYFINSSSFATRPTDPPVFTLKPSFPEKSQEEVKKDLPSELKDLNPVLLTKALSLDLQGLPERALNALDGTMNELLKSLPKDSKLIVFDSRHDGPDLVIYTKTKDYERYIDFELGHPPDLGSSAIVMTVMKNDPAGKPLLKPKVSRSRLGVRSGKFLPTEQPARDCVSCHLGGAMPLTPTENSGQGIWGANQEDLKNFPNILKNPTQWFNEEVAPNLNSADHGFDLTQLGPGIGPVNPKERTEDFMKACASPILNREEIDPATIRWNRVKNAMNCSSCHNGRPGQPTILNHGTKEKILEHMIEGGSMPPSGKTELTSMERTIVARCLQDEYFQGFNGTGSSSKKMGILKTWLLSVKCPTSTLTSNPAAQENRESKEINSETTPVTSSPTSVPDDHPGSESQTGH